MRRRTIAPLEHFQIEPPTVTQCGEDHFQQGARFRRDFLLDRFDLFFPGRLFDRNAPQSTDLFIDFEPFLTESQEIVKFLYLSLRFAQGSHG